MKYHQKFNLVTLAHDYLDWAVTNGHNPAPLSVFEVSQFLAFKKHILDDLTTHKLYQKLRAIYSV